MNVLASFSEYTDTNTPLVVVLGTFDGFHKGHQSLLCQAHKLAEKQEAKVAIVTFSAHPMQVLNPSQQPLTICQDWEKKRIEEDLGVSIVFSLPMSTKLLQVTAASFMEALWHLPLAGLVVGENFTFGKGGLGTPDQLIAYGKKWQTPVVISPLLVDKKAGRPISSTWIRQLIIKGDLEEARRLLGRPFMFRGEIIHGDERGRTLGFPTLNFLLPKELAVPPDGVYANRIYLGGSWYNGVGNIGDNPTFSNQYYRCEVHVFDFNQNVYGQEAVVTFEKQLRGEVKFVSLAELVAQMALDKQKAREYLAMLEPVDLSLS